ncbi:hypothetical protein [Sphingomonas sp.]|uniref:hypothetical protein n=1 Tax=Sphingomonas sp. TaxID=28214 RepID=UPI000DBBE298|nr:hypothetical protein [Sphingomonas sp.]PZT91962.1 MAG: hypothetical protein DI625_14610 [Sphingomonas sp.]
MNAFAPSPLAFTDAVAAANQWVDDAADLIAQYHRLARDRDMWTERAAGAIGNDRWWCVNMAGILTDTMLLAKDAIEAVRDDTLSGLYLTAHHVPAALVEAADNFNDRLSDDCISLDDALRRAAALAKDQGR